MVEVTLVAMRSVTVVPAKLAAPEIFKLVEVTPPTTCKPPCTAKVSIGEDELIPTLPFVRTVNIEPAPAVEVTIEKGFSVPAPCTNNLAKGVEVPIPTLPFAKTLNMFAVWAESILNMEEVAPVDEANTDRAPWDIIPPAPTTKDVPAIILP